jgi:amylosucrase
VELAVRALQDLPPVPATTAWICYLRCHDDIGWAVDDADAAAVGVSGFGHRTFLSDFYTGRFPGSFARGLVFQANPATADRRVSGMTHALTGLQAAAELEDADAADAATESAIARILVAHAILLGWGGVPVLWMGDELALPSDPHWADESGHAADNRWTHRPRMDAQLQAARHDPDTVTGRVFAGLRHLIATRASLPLLHAATQPQVLDPSDRGVLAVLRSHPEGQLLELYNVTDSWRPFPASRVADHGLPLATDVLSGEAVAAAPDGNLWLAPYRAVWLVRS